MKAKVLLTIIFENFLFGTFYCKIEVKIKVTYVSRLAPNHTLKKIFIILIKQDIRFPSRKGNEIIPNPQHLEIVIFI